MHRFFPIDFTKKTVKHIQHCATPFQEPITLFADCLLRPKASDISSFRQIDHAVESLGVNTLIPANIDLGSEKGMRPHPLFCD